MRELVPTELVLPCENNAATIGIMIRVDADTGRVYAPGLRELQAALAHGSADVVEQYCELWTRWLSRFGGPS